MGIENWAYDKPSRTNFIINTARKIFNEAEFTLASIIYNVKYSCHL